MGHILYSLVWFDVNLIYLKDSHLLPNYSSDLNSKAKWYQQKTPENSMRNLASCLEKMGF